MGEIRHRANTVAAVLLIHQTITALIMFCALFIAAGNGKPWIQNYLDSSCTVYLLSAAVGWMLLLMCKRALWLPGTPVPKGRRMRVGKFLRLLIFSLGVQLIGQLSFLLIQWISEQFGISFSDILTGMSVSVKKPSVFLYVFIAAPLWEELLFRGLILHTFEAFSKRLGIVASAILFALFHSNPIQIIYSFFLGIILGYAAQQYHLLWAMLLHGISNFVYAYMLPKLLACLPVGLGNWIHWAVVVAFFVTALIVLAVNVNQIVPYFQHNRSIKGQYRELFAAPMVIVFYTVSIVQIFLFFRIGLGTLP